MELSSVGRHILLVIFLLGSNVLLLNAQAQSGVLPADRADPQLPGVPVGPGPAPADCGMLPTVCAFNTSLPDYQNCRRYYTCGFSNNWQPRQCRGNQDYNTDTLTCVPSGTGKCGSCADRNTPVDCSTRPATCNERDLLPDYDNCKKYYRCVRNTWQSLVCTGNNNFDQTTMSCMNVRQARCAMCTGAPGPTGQPPITAIEPTSMPNPNPPGPTRAPAVTRPLPTWVPLPTRAPTGVPLPSRVPPTLIPPFTRTPLPPVSTPRPYNPAEWGNSNDEACRLVPTDPCSQPDLLVADAKDCSRYYQCIGNIKRWLSRDCPAGTMFDATTKICDHTRDAECQLPCPRRECLLASSGSCTLQEKIGDPTDCTRFYLCWALGSNQPTQWIGGVCPTSQPYFNSRTLVCETSPTSCIAPCTPPTVASPTAATTPAATTASLSTTSASPPPFTGKDITLTMPLDEVCNSPNRKGRADHASCTSARSHYVHRHPTDCNIIYICLGGRWVRGTCRADELWSITNGSCVPKDAAVCFNITCFPTNQDTTIASTAPSSTTSITPSTTASPTTPAPTTTTSTKAPTTSATTKAPTTASTTVASTTVITDGPSTAPSSTIGQQSPSTEPPTKATLGTTSSATTRPVFTSTPPADTTSQQPSTTVYETTTQSTTASPASSPSTTGKTSPSSPSTSTPTTTTSTTTSKALPIECEKERTGSWPQTPIGGEARGSCPKGFSGYSVRQCVWMSGVGASWTRPDVNLCVDPLYEDVLLQAEQLQVPPPTSPPGVTGRPSVTDRQLKDTIIKLSVLTTRDVRQDGGIQGGNLNASVEAVSVITRLVQERNLTLTQLETQALFNTAGNFLSTKNRDSWKAITRQDPSRGVTVMASVDEIGRQMARNSGGNPVTTRAGSLAIRAEIRRKEEIETFDYTPDPPPGSTPDPTGLRDRVILEKETLEELSEDLPGDMIAVWSTYFYTINDYLPVQGGQFLNSRVMSVSVQGLPNGEILRPPVRLYFAPLNHTVSDVETQCSFWKFGAMNRGRWSDEGCKVVSSDTSGTVCECDHLTNFAILLSPSPAAGMHATILGIISVIGCLLSILGMLITICLYILSWKRVKSHHAAVLINLCIALIIANTTFLAGIERTEDPLICTVIAAMLHFFYLVAFFMMFADGVQFILYVVQVFHVRRKKETFLLVLTCWVIPGVIVAITMSITRAEGYGTEDYCWLRKDTGLIAAFAVPAILVMIANFVVLCKILHTISNSKGSERTNRVKATIWNVAVMMPLLGLTWVFALFAVNDQTITFQYLFCVCNSLQGFFIFFFHCALNKKMRQAVVERFSSRSSLSSSMRKSAGSNKSDKKKCAEKKSNKKATKNNQKGKPEISPPKPTGRQREYIVPRNAHQGATPAYNDQQHYQGAPPDGSHQMAPPSGVPTPPPISEPQYMDLEEVKGAVKAANSSPMVGRRLEAQYPTGYRPGEREAGGQPPYGGSPADGYRSAERRAYGNQRGLPRYDQQQQGVLPPMAGHHNDLSTGQQGYSSLERRPYGYDMSPDLRYRRDRDMQQIDLNFAANENSLNRGGGGGGYGGSWDRRGESSDLDPNQPQPWWYGGPHTNQSFRHSMDDLRMAGGSPTQEGPAQPSSNGIMPREAVEDPYLFPRSHEDDMTMQTNPLAQARTFDPRRPARKSPYLQRVHRLGSHSRSLDRLDHRGRAPRRPHQAPAAISTASMQRFASKEAGGAYIILEPQVYENLSFDGLKGHTSDEPVYMQIDDVTVLDSQVSLDFMAGRA